MTADRELRNLYETYNKKLLALHKANFSVLGNNLDYFVTYLKLLRDHYILTEKTAEEKLKTASLITAVKEYENYNSCITKYYKLVGNDIQKISEEPEEEVEKKFEEERAFHWTSFWKLIMLNIEDWGVNG